jgi:hypothetical protein
LGKNIQPEEARRDFGEEFQEDAGEEYRIFKPALSPHFQTGAHICSLYTKLAAHSRVEAIRAAASFLQANARQRQLERLIAAQQAECQIR